MVLYIYIYEHNVDLHFARDYVTKGLLNVSHVSSHDQIVDLMIK